MVDLVLVISVESLQPHVHFHSADKQSSHMQSIPHDSGHLLVVQVDLCFLFVGNLELDKLGQELLKGRVPFLEGIIIVSLNRL